MHTSRRKYWIYSLISQIVPGCEKNRMKRLKDGQKCTALFKKQSKDSAGSCTLKPKLLHSHISGRLNANIFINNSPGADSASNRNEYQESSWG
jgi:hypothetical protein